MRLFHVSTPFINRARIFWIRKTEGIRRRKQKNQERRRTGHTDGRIILWRSCHFPNSSCMAANEHRQDKMFWAVTRLTEMWSHAEQARVMCRASCASNCLKIKVWKQWGLCSPVVSVWSSTILPKYPWYTVLEKLWILWRTTLLFYLLFKINQLYVPGPGGTRP